MPLEVNWNTVPHLKALISGIESLSCHLRGRTFLETRTIWKVLILLHTEPSELSVLLLFVCVSHWNFCFYSRFIRVFYVAIVLSCSRKSVIWKPTLNLFTEYPVGIITTPNNLPVYLDKNTILSVLFAQKLLHLRIWTLMDASYPVKNILIVLFVPENFRHNPN